MEEAGVFGVAFEFVLDGFEDAVFAAVGGEVDGVALCGLDELAEVHGFAESGFAFEDELALEFGEGFEVAAVAGTGLGGGKVVGVGVLVEQVGVGEEAGAEGGEEPIAQERDPGEQEADVAKSGDVADPGVPEEDGLDLGGFGVEEDEGDPESDVDEEGLNDCGAPFVEGDRLDGVVEVGAGVAAGFEGGGEGGQEGNVVGLPGDVAVVGDFAGLGGEVVAEIGEIGAGVPGGLEDFEGGFGFVVGEFFGDCFGFANPVEEGFGVFVAECSGFDEESTFL